MKNLIVLILAIVLSSVPGYTSYMYHLSHSSSISYFDGESFQISTGNESRVAARVKKGDALEIILGVTNLSNSSFVVGPSIINVTYVVGSLRNQATVYSANEWLRKIQRVQNVTAAVTGISQGLEQANAGKSTSYTTASAYGSNGSSAYGYGMTTTYDPAKAATVRSLHSQENNQMQQNFNSIMSSARSKLLQTNTIPPGSSISGVIMADYARANHIEVTVQCGKDRHFFAFSISNQQFYTGPTFNNPVIETSKPNNKVGVDQHALDKITAIYSVVQNPTNATAQYNLGCAYDNGEGIPQNKALAAEWWRKAAVQGLADAQYNLGVAYSKGEGVPQNSATAAEWYSKAAAQGDADAQNALVTIRLHSKDISQTLTPIIERYREQADQGDATAQYNLGCAYDNGEGVPQNRTKAAGWWRKAADQGLADAQYNLGVAYLKGEGVPQSRITAAEWYSKAAGQGDVDAQNALKTLMSSIEDSSQNLTTADEMYREKADHGDANAQFQLGIAYAKGDGEPQNKITAAEWFRKSADQGFAEAQYTLGLCFFNGDGVPQSNTAAKKWFKAAAVQGNSKAKNMLDGME